MPEILKAKGSGGPRRLQEKKRKRKSPQHLLPVPVLSPALLLRQRTPSLTSVSIQKPGWPVCQSLTHLEGRHIRGAPGPQTCLSRAQTTEPHLHSPDYLFHPIFGSHGPPFCLGPLTAPPVVYSVPPQWAAWLAWMQAYTNCTFVCTLWTPVWSS